MTKLQIKIDKIRKLDADQALKVIWGWVKDDVISLKEFKILIDVIVTEQSMKSYHIATLECSRIQI